MDCRPSPRPERHLPHRKRMGKRKNSDRYLVSDYAFLRDFWHEALVTIGYKV
jgi:hypothetical protein